MEYALEQYTRSIKTLVEEFVSIYYPWADYFIIGEWSRLAPNVIGIADDFWNVDQMYEALLNDIPKDKLFEWYDYQLDQHLKNKEVINLTTYCCWMIIYTKEEVQESEKRAMKAKKILEESLKNII